VSRTQRLAAYSGVTLFSANNWQVPVCFLTAGYAGDKTNIRTTIENTWGRSGLTFTGWGSCANPPPANSVPIELVEDGGSGGVAAAGLGSRLGGGANAPQIQLFFGSSRAFLLSNSVHEMGHALGFPHEMQRDDKTTCPTPAGADSQWDILPGIPKASPYDPDSIMNYCRDYDRDGNGDINGGGETDDNFALTNLDLAGVRLLYGTRPNETLDAAFALVAGNTNTGTWTPAGQNSWNSAGAVNSATRNGVGSYTVTFPRIGNSAGGNVQVTGGTTRQCKMSSWSVTSSSVNVAVNCKNEYSQAADAEFMVSYVRRFDNPGIGEGAYLYYSGSSVPATYSWNSMGGTNSVTRNGTGSYTATLPSIGADGVANGTVIVTGYGTDATHCKVANWSLSGSNVLVNVLCFDHANASDSAFSLSYSRQSPTGTPSVGYLWANDPSNTALYYPLSGYRALKINRGDGTHSWSDNAFSVQRQTIGSYLVRFKDLPYTSDPQLLYEKSSVHVTAYGNNSNYCTLGSRWGDDVNGYVTVNCWNYSGVASDTVFAVSYGSTLSANGPVYGIRANANNQIVTAENAGASSLIANRTAIGAWERFELISNGDFTVSLFALINRRYVTAENAGAAALIANRTGIGNWEMFRRTKNADGSLSFTAVVNGKYVTAEDGGNSPLIANRTAIGDWEKFRLEGAP
jgi:hypothetical protein